MSQPDPLAVAAAAKQRAEESFAKPTSKEPRPLRFRWDDAIKTSDLPSSRRHVAHVLATHMNLDGGSCFPSYETIASETGLTKKTVTVAVAELEQHGYLHIKRGGGAGKSNHYQALMPHENGEPQ